MSNIRQYTSRDLAVVKELVVQLHEYEWLKN